MVGWISCAQSCADVLLRVVSFWTEKHTIGAVKLPQHRYQTLRVADVSMPVLGAMLIKDSSI